MSRTFFVRLILHEVKVYANLPATAPAAVGIMATVPPAAASVPVSLHNRAVCGGRLIDVTPLAGAADAPDVPMKPMPAATIAARISARILNLLSKTGCTA